MSVEKELPDEQQPDGELDGDVEMQAYEEARKIEKQFDDIVTSTIDDYTTRSTVKEINTAPSGNTIVVSVDIAAIDGAKDFRFPKPKLDSERYSFVRWLNKYGYTLSDFSGMVEKGVEVEVEETNDSYALVYPDHNPKSRLRRGGEWLANGAKSVDNFTEIVALVVGSLAGALLYSVLAYESIPLIFVLGMFVTQLAGMASFVLLTVLFLVALN